MVTGRNVRKVGVMTSGQFLFLFVTGLMFFAVGCFGPEGARGIDAGPTKTFVKWVETIEQNDYTSMWKMLPITAKERFRYAWDDEKEQLKKSTVEMKSRFMKVYGFQNWSEIENEEAADFFVRSMGSFPKEKEIPMKYKLLKKAKIHKIIYGDEGSSCIVSFISPEGQILPMQMKMLREGNDWKVVRLP